MDNFVFVNSLEPASGRARDPQTKRFIRAVAKRHHWKNVAAHRHLTTHSPMPNGEDSATSRSRMAISESWPPIQSSTEEASGEPAVFKDLSRVEAYGDSSKEPQATAGSKAKIHTAGLRPCYHLGGAKDFFCYIAPDFGVEEYGLFTHYAVEFHVVLCDSVHPILPPQQNVCCDIAMRQCSPSLLHAICCFSAAHESVHGVQTSKLRELFRSAAWLSDLQYRAIRHRMYSIALLRTEVANCQSVSLAILQCTILLLGFEAILGDDIVALRAHWYGMRSMIYALGGESRIPAAVWIQARFMDTKTALILDCAPHFAVDRSLLSHMNTVVMEQSMRPKSHILGNAQFQVVQVDLETRKYMEVARYLTPSKEFYHNPLSSSNCSLEDFLAFESALLGSTDQSDQVKLDYCIRLALLLYSNIEIWMTPLYFGWVTALRLRLKKSLKVACDSEIGYSDTCLLWMFMLGRVASYSGSGDEKAWWNAKLRSTVARLGITQWSEAESILRQFTYNKDYGAERGAAIWNSVIVNDRSACNNMLLPHPCTYQRG